jgi:ADP-ribose pyrophosphatase
VRHAGSAVMMAVDEKKRILLVRQFRLPAMKKMWELPAGKVDDGEKPLQAARRELIEETGYRARKWSGWGRSSSAPATYRSGCTSTSRPA